MKNYPTPKRVKIGKMKYVVDLDGKTPIIGLSLDKGNGQYYYTFFKSEKDFRTGTKTRKDYSFGVDYQTAVFRFKQWKQNLSKFSLTVPAVTETEQTITKTLSEQERKGLQQIYDDLGVDKKAPDKLVFGGRDLEDLGGNYKIESHIITDKQYALNLLKQLLNDEEIKIEAIRLLKLNELLPKEHKIITLKEIVDFYGQNSGSNIREKGRIKMIFNHFTSTTKKTNINSITESDLVIFRDNVKNSKMADTYKKSFMVKFKTAINFYLENKNCNGEKELIRNFLLLCKEKLKSDYKNIDDNPQAIDKKTLKKIFDKAKQDKEIYLMFLLMLNCGFTPVDIRQLKKSMIKKQDDLTYLIHRRTKTKGQYIRVNCLWSITVKLLEEQAKVNPNSDYIFTSKHGGSYCESALSLRFKTFFEDIKRLDNTKVSAKHFKDTVVTTLAFAVFDNVLKVTIGHSIGKSKDSFWWYVESKPEQQKPAIDVLWSRFKDLF